VTPRIYPEDSNPGSIIEYMFCYVKRGRLIKGVKEKPVAPSNDGDFVLE
jgi:hypothetical protein